MPRIKIEINMRDGKYIIDDTDNPKKYDLVSLTNEIRRRINNNGQDHEIKISYKASNVMGQRGRTFIRNFAEDHDIPLEEQQK